METLPRNTTTTRNNRLPIDTTTTTTTTSSQNTSNDALDSPSPPPLVTNSLPTSLTLSGEHLLRSRDIDAGSTSSSVSPRYDDGEDVAHGVGAEDTDRRSDNVSNSMMFSDNIGNLSVLSEDVMSASVLSDVVNVSVDDVVDLSLPSQNEENDDGEGGEEGDRNIVTRATNSPFTVMLETDDSSAVQPYPTASSYNEPCPTTATSSSLCDGMVTPPLASPPTSPVVSSDRSPVVHVDEGSTHGTTSLFDDEELAQLTSRKVNLFRNDDSPSHEVDDTWSGRIFVCDNDIAVLGY